LALVGTGVLVLTGLAGAASADDTKYQPNGNGADTNLLLDVESTAGALWMVVDNADVVLGEETTGVPVSERWFTGTLGDVTIHDTRSADQIDPDVHWWVGGVATDFVAQAGQSSDIGAENLGWAPAFTDPTYTGLVSAGLPVDPALDGGPGLEGLLGQEYLVEVATSSDDPDVVDEDEWTANAELILKVGGSVEPGAYASVLTLSLFE
jgi:hypothetical protein